MTASYGRILSLTKHLVSISSVSGNEASILDFTDGWMQSHDFDQTVRQTGFAAGKIAGSEAKNALILCGHVDTVVPGVAGEWQTDPLVATDIDGKLYGLGTTDMKAGLAMQLVTAHEAAGEQLPIDIWVAAVAGEEIDGNGSRAFVEWFKKNTDYEHAACLIAEPTDLARVEIAHRGSRFIRLTFEGKASHASNQASYGVSGLKRAYDFLAELPRVVEQARLSYTDPLLGEPSIVPTVMRAGDETSPNKTSDIAQLVLDIRTTPAFDEVFTDWIDALTKRCGAAWQDVGAPLNASVCSPNAAIARAALQTTGITTPSISLGATDQASFQPAGIDTVVFGPGRFDKAHTPNEYIDLAALRESIDIYARLIRAYHP